MGALKKARGLEDGVQVVEVGSNLFQFKFRSKFELNRVYIGGIWSFDNRALLLTGWKSGMTATNVKFDSISLRVQIWGGRFDIRTAWVAEEAGNRLGRILEVEKRGNIDGQNLFMRVKVAISLEKEIRHGAFLAGLNGKKFWVDLRYERLPVLCHYCGLLRHELRFCAQYFSKTKSGAKVKCGYGDWLKATGGRMRSPQRRRFMKDNVHEGNRGEQTQSTSQSASEMGVRGVGEDRNRTKMVMEIVGGATGLVGEDWADSEIRIENHGIGDMDEENKDSCSLFLGAQNSCLPKGIELAPTTHEEHV